MTTKRHFIGWDRHATEAVRDFLILDEITESIDLGDTLIVVPTRQASRRLRESMASHCADSDAALLSPQVCVPNAFFRPEDRAGYRETGNLLTRSIWSDILVNSTSSDFPTLFPAAIERNQMWAERTGDVLQDLREALADGGHTIQNVIDDHAEILEEVDRWNDLAEAEQRYLSRVKELGYNDATLRKIEKSKNPTIPDGIKRIVVASVPDPSLLMLSALSVLAETIPIEILIMAPEDQSEMFDEWGRAIPAKWINKQIDIPDADNTVMLTGTPKDQATLAIQSIAKESDNFGPRDIAVGVPDRSVITFLETNLTELGLNVFDPAEKFLRDHPIFGMLEQFTSLYTTKTYTDLRNLVRHPDMLAYFKTKSISPTKLLTALDKFQNKYLPTRFEDVNLVRLEYKSGTSTPQSTASKQEPPLVIMLQVLTPLLNLFDSLTPDEAIRSLLQTVYRERMLNSKNSADQEFTVAGEKITEVLREFASCNAPFPPPHSSHSLSHKSEIINHNSPPSLSILIDTLSEQTYHADRDDPQIDLEGWLELPWNNAPFMIVTGMNEGRVPDGHLSDMFLPDSLRNHLELRNDAGRLARDAYLMTMLIETRRNNGKTIFITGKISTTGDPLKPSRLLFRCTQSELVPRAEKLFATINKREALHASTVSFKLNPTPLLDDQASPIITPVTKLSVTSFSSYLSCPFRFYLGNVMRMRTLDDSKREMDAMDFGSLIHAALQRMGETDIWQSEDPKVISEFLIAEAERSIKLQFSDNLPIPVQISLDSARQRLRQAAAVQTELTREGWDIIQTESRCEMTIDNMLIRGTIDRVDKNRDTGAIRIIDYKTSDTEKTPLKAHIASPRQDSPECAQLEIDGKEKRWIDLQLPLYQPLLQANGLEADKTEIAYFNLPKAVTQTGIYTWDNWNRTLLDSAYSCAKEIINKIQSNIFWPPAENIKYDDYETLLPAPPEECFEPILPNGKPSGGNQ